MLGQARQEARRGMSPQPGLEEIHFSFYAKNRDDQFSWWYLPQECGPGSAKCVVRKSSGVTH